MTREEALEFIAQSVKSDVDMALVADALKALEQESCEDCISREQAIKQCGFGMTSLLIADNLRKIPPIKPKIKTGHWFPVSERLPEYGKEVLTCSNGGFIEIQSLEDGGYWENQKGDWTDFDEVIAWMPLPKPYKPQESEET